MRTKTISTLPSYKNSCAIGKTDSCQMNDKYVIIYLSKEREGKNMKLYIVKFNGIGYQAVEGVFTTREKAVFFLEETLGMEASNGNVWIDPLEGAEPGFFMIKECEVGKTDTVYIVEYSLETSLGNIANVFSSRNEAVAYIEQDKELVHTDYNLWEHKELEYEYWQIEEMDIL